MTQVPEVARISGLIVLILGILHFQAAGASQYTLTDLGTLGGTKSVAYGINNAGQVVGSAYTESGDQHAVVWDGTTPTDLSAVSGGIFGVAYGINNVGQVVGYSGGLMAPAATLWNYTTGNASLLASQISYAFDINDAGQVAGFYGSKATRWTCALSACQSPEDSPRIYLDPLGGLPYLGSNIAFSANNVGQLVGVSGAAPAGLPHATLWYGTDATDLGTLGGTDSGASGINDSGTVVGYAFLADGTRRATLWIGTTAIDLGTLGGTTSNANAINNGGQVVGSAFTSDGVKHAALWDGTTAIDLNSLISPTLAEHVTLDYAFDINDNGWITANGTDSRTGESHAYVLSPVPLPGTWWLLLTGLGGLGAFARKRRAA